MWREKLHCTFGLLRFKQTKKSAVKISNQKGIKLERDHWRDKYRCNFWPWWHSLIEANMWWRKLWLKYRYSSPHFARIFIPLLLLLLYLGIILSYLFWKIDFFWMEVKAINFINIFFSTWHLFSNLKLLKLLIEQVNICLFSSAQV